MADTCAAGSTTACIAGSGACFAVSSASKPAGCQEQGFEESFAGFGFGQQSCPQGAFVGASSRGKQLRQGAPSIAAASAATPSNCTQLRIMTRSSAYQKWGQSPIKMGTVTNISARGRAPCTDMMVAECAVIGSNCPLHAAGR